MQIKSEVQDMIVQQADVTGLQGRKRLVKEEGPGTNVDPTWMDREREDLQAYEYLCHIGETKEWIEACIKDSICAIDEMEEELRNGIVFAHLTQFFAANCVKRIFEDRSRLQFRHSDNINYFFEGMRQVGLPDVFFFELTDLYEKKNIPKVIYCVHALAHLLYKKGLAPPISNLVGKLQFTDEQLGAINQSLAEAGVAMPSFGDVGNALAKEMGEPQPTPEQLRRQYLLDHVDQIIKCQAVARGWLAVRQAKQFRLQREADQERARQQRIRDNVAGIIRIQAAWRGYVAHRLYQNRLKQLRGHDQLWAKLQAQIRSKKQREAYLQRLAYLKAHEVQVTQIQSFWRAKHAQRAYRQLRVGDKSASVSVLKNFLHLMDDSGIDYEEEFDLDRLRQLVVRRIRECNVLDNEVTSLDTQIALLVKNRISLDELAHYSSKHLKKALNAELAMKDQDAAYYSLKGHDKETKQRVETYSQLFYLLQTKPQYLAHLMNTLNKKSGTSVTRFLEQVVLTLYGYAQNTREEYLLLNLIKASITIEIDEISDIGDFWRANPLFIRLVLHYTRGAKERQFLRDLLQPLVKEVIEDRDLNLEIDAIAIYKILIRDEELRTGEKSTRPYDATPTQAANDPEVQRIQKERFETLRRTTDKFLDAIIASLRKMPYGIRYIASQMKEAMREKFNASEDETNHVVGNLIYYRYMNPAIAAPEAFDVIDSAISPVQRKNLAEIAKTLYQLSYNKQTATDNTAYGATLNEYITRGGKRFQAYFKDAASVMTPEEHFGIDEFADAGRQQKPTIYITPKEIFSIHRNLDDNINDIAPTEEADELRIVLKALGPPPPARDEKELGTNEISLRLSNRFVKPINPDEARKRKAFADTKRGIITIIRIQTGANLLDILESPVTEREEQLFTEYLQQEQVRQDVIALQRARQRAVASSSTALNQPASPLGSTGALNQETFSQLKRATLENMALLEKDELVTRKDNYQSMVDEITKDMLNKHRRRSQRKRELASIRQTLANIEDRTSYLGDQKNSYYDYINSCMSQLGANKKKGTKSKPLPFTKQYYHIRELNKTGKVPQFGSYKYTAADLSKKGILLGVTDYSPKQYGGITLTISSDEAGVFKIDAAFLGVKVQDTMELRLEDLLQYQYDNVQVITLFDMAKVNLNLLIYLINKKFFV